MKNLDLEKYQPLNTSEKVQALVQEISQKKRINKPFDEFVNEVCFQIRKAKLQVLFREKVKPLKRKFKSTKSPKQKPLTKTSPKKDKPPKPQKRKKKKENAINPLKLRDETIERKIESYQNKTIKELASILHWDIELLNKLLKQHNIYCKTDICLSQEEFALMHDTFHSRLKAIIKQEEKAEFDKKYKTNYKLKEIRNKKTSKKESAFDKIANIKGNKKPIYIRSK